MSLEGRHALVTGGGRGIGRAVAVALTAAGASVTVMGRTARDLEAVVASGAARRYLICDVMEEAAVAAAVTAAESHGPIDILVANAGAAESAPFLKADAAMFRRMIDLNSCPA
jgi:3-hydroxybutyrate dehydrogenase